MFSTQAYHLPVFAPAINYFAIDGATGDITSTSVMNRTEMSSYSLTVSASDPTSHIAKLDITIDVNAAVFLHGGYVSMVVLLALFIVH